LAAIYLDLVAGASASACTAARVSNLPITMWHACARARWRHFFSLAPALGAGWPTNTSTSSRWQSGGWHIAGLDDHPEAAAEAGVLVIASGGETGPGSRAWSPSPTSV